MTEADLHPPLPHRTDRVPFTSAAGDRLHLIGLCGPAGAGKSTVAAYLEERWAFQEIAFADPILDMVCTLFQHAGIDPAWAVERSLKEKPTTLGVSYRRLAQTLGTEWGRRVIADDLWVRVAAARVLELQSTGDHVVISDVRFSNEAEWLQRKGGVLVRVARSGLAELPAGASRHPSEACQPALRADHVLFNHGSVATLHDQIDRLVESLRSHA
jgi:hypothetical protein